MIRYEPENSSFYATNQSYCEDIESKIRTLKSECTGYCNAYGYDFETSFNKNNLNYSLKCEKHQTTQNGVVLPTDAHDSAGIEIRIKGLDKKYSLSFGKSALRRFFAPSRYKSIVPKPYFIDFNYTPTDDFVESLYRTIYDNLVSKLQLKNGMLLCKVNSDMVDPLDLIADLERTSTPGPHKS